MQAFGDPIGLLHSMGGALFALTNHVLARLLASRVQSNSVLHISHLVHIPYYTVQLLREHGMKADYLAIGTSKVWNKCDFQLIPHQWRLVRIVQQFFMFWWIVARYEIVHLHFMISISCNGWELPLLKRMGRKVVVHYRGCEIRNRAHNIRLHAECNICQECDYNASICSDPVNLRRQTLSRQYGDLFLVTTPDLLEFTDRGIHLPFFMPSKKELTDANRKADGKQTRDFRIVHATNHPGIEGTREIRAVIERLTIKGYSIDFVVLQGVPPSRVMAEYAQADLAIGKMKMGYYANSQIESMAFGVPTVTYVHREFMTPELQESGFILCNLAELETTLELYLSNPEALEDKRRRAITSIQRLHDNDKICERLIELYRTVKLGGLRVERAA